MMDDPASRPPPVEDPAQLIERVRAAIVRVQELAEPDSRSSPTGKDGARLLEKAQAAVAHTQNLIEAVRAARMRAASLRVEKATEREEMRFRRMARRKVDRFP